MFTLKWIPLVGCLVAVVLACVTLDQPSNNGGNNSDEINIASVAVSLATQGRYKATTLPDHLMRTEAVCASNPMLYPYGAALAVKLFGVARWSIRLPSLLYYLGGFLCLYGLCASLALDDSRTFSVLACYVGSPWMLQPAVIGRPEMLSIFLCYLATLSIISGPGIFHSTRISLAAAASLCILAVWNSPLFLGVAVLPCIVGVHFGRIDPKSPGNWAVFIGSAIATLAALFVVIVLPHWDAWLEQFPRNALTYSARSPHPHGVSLRFAWERLVELRSRASVLGMPFITWYVASASWLLLCRFSREAWTALAVMILFLIAVDLKTPTHYYTLEQLGAAVPLIFLLVSTRQEDAGFKPAWRVVYTLLSVCCFLHPLMLLLPRAEAKEFSAREILFARSLQLEQVPAKCVTGPLEAAFPAWKAGLRYIAPTPGFFEEDTQVKSIYQRETAQQAFPLDRLQSGNDAASPHEPQP